ncbi:DoxX family protein [Planctomonas psychrotolerans]|uniref:DoxX family protein n=1 Tax=Planctomonas psychrotolerans TaxID=2528712 RepID=UPI001D0D21D5|nr:DoxX family protein [Planctomonas psychrotolerans]
MDASTLEVIQLVVRVLLAAVFVAMGVTHFLPGPSRVMAKLIPPALRTEGLLNPRNLVLFTGVCEILGGIGLLIPQTQLAAGIALVFFLLAVFPANAYASQHPEEFGVVAVPFLPRLFGQLLLIGLVLFAALPLSGR